MPPPTPSTPDGLLLVSAPSPDHIGAFFPLSAEGLVIGRATGADIRVDDPGISRRHVRIARGASGGVVAEDLGSTNGTFLNGIGISSSILREGDRLQIGASTEFLFGMPSERARAEVLLRQALSTSRAGTWEWFPATGSLKVYGGIARPKTDPVDSTEPRPEDSWERVHPDDRQALRNGLRRALERGSTFDAEARLLTPDGRVTWAAMTGELFRDREGQPVRLAGTLLDVTEHRRADAELRRHSLLFDSLSDAVIVVGADATILDWSRSAEEIFGWSKAEALGRRARGLLVAEHQDQLDAKLLECAHGSVRRSEQLVLRSKSGAEIPVEMVAVPLVVPDEDLMASVAVFRDLRERNRLAARLEVAERLAALGTLAAGVAHEINNPLSFVISNLDYIRGRLEGAAPALDTQHADLVAALADSRKGGERIAAIVRDLQTFCGKGHADPADPVDPNVALEFALRMIEGRIRHRARLVKDLTPVPKVKGGESRLGQVFLNLILNAVQAMPPGSAKENVIRVSSRVEGTTGRVMVEVADDGLGIPADVLPRLFEPFFSTKAVGAGHGLGLSVSHGIVSDLGGEITVESEVGKGTIFRVLLPAVESVPEHKRVRVLIVDDEPLIGTSLKRLVADPYEVVSIGDPREALARIRSGEQFAFAVVDLQMPEMSGQEFLVALRESAPELARRAVVVTGESPDEVAARFPELPLILPKPIEVPRLLKLIEAVANYC